MTVEEAYKIAKTFDKTDLPLLSCVEYDNAFSFYFGTGKEVGLPCVEIIKSSGKASYSFWWNRTGKESFKVIDIEAIT